MGLRRDDGARRLAGVSGVLAQRAPREAEARLAGQPRRLAHVRGSRWQPSDWAGHLVAFHTGAHVEASERGVSGLSEFGDPPSEVLDALTFCDLTTGPDGS